MKKVLITALIMTSISFAAFAQNNNQRSQPMSYKNALQTREIMDKMIFGLDLSSINPYFFNNTFRIGFRPIVGYKFNNYLSAGISMSYIYASARNYFTLYDPNGNIVYKPFRYYNYAGGVWTRALIFSSFFAHVEFERNLLQEQYWSNVGADLVKTKNSEWVNCLLVGGGWKQQISEKFSFTTTLLYDVLQNTQANLRQQPGSVAPPTSISPYAGSLEYRFGLNFGF